jgi:predicted dehydrogenase
MTSTGAAVIGTGFMCVAHTEALRRIGVHVAGVLGSSPEKSRKAVESLRLPSAKAYASLEDLLRDPAVHSVHVATPNRLHFEEAKRSLEAGKHVMCEKPLAMDPSESAELVALARRHPRLAAGVNYNVRYYPLCVEARERVRGGEIGDVLHACGSYVQDWLLFDTDYNWRVLADQGGELRAVADIGTHWLDLVYAITGLEVEAVCADLKTVHPVRRRPRGEVETFKSKEGAGGGDTEPTTVTTDDYGSVLLRYRGGARGVVWVSQVTAGRKNCVRFEIAGSRRALAWDSERPDELWVGRRDGPNESLLKDPSLLTPAARNATGYPGGHVEGYADSFKQCFRAFYGYTERGDFSAPPTFPTFEEGHREIVLCDAILRSHREARWVDIAS